MANIGGNIGAMKGSKIEARGYDKAQEILKRLEKEAVTTQNKIDPWNQYRQGYADQLNNILQGKSSWQTDPGYQFRMQESQREVERSGMAQGYGMSGNMAAALQKRSQDLASSEYGNIINRLIGLSAATPQNAIAGGQAYGNLMQASIEGQAQAQIGQSAAKGRQAAFRGEAIHSLAEVIMSQGQATTQGGSTGYQGANGGYQGSAGSGGGAMDFSSWMQGGGGTEGGYKTSFGGFF